MKRHSSVSIQAYSLQSMVFFEAVTLLFVILTLTIEDSMKLTVCDSVAVNMCKA